MSRAHPYIHTRYIDNNNSRNDESLEEARRAASCATHSLRPRGGGVACPTPASTQKYKHCQQSDSSHKKRKTLYTPHARTGDKVRTHASQSPSPDPLHNRCGRRSVGTAPGLPLLHQSAPLVYDHYCCCCYCDSITTLDRKWIFLQWFPYYQGYTLVPIKALHRMNTN